MKNIFLVDADDTVLDFHGVSAAALRNAFAESGIVWEDRFAIEYKKINEKLWEALERKELTRSELMDKRFDIVLEHLHIANVNGTEFNKKYLHYIATNPLYFDGAENFLKQLNKMGDVYIVTNGTAWIQDSRFEKSQLLKYAKQAFISERVGFDKPDKRYTQYIMDNIPNFQVDNAVWIGDSLSADIKAANDAGITAIWYNRYKKELKGDYKPDFITDDFEEILSFLKKLS